MLKRKFFMADKVREQKGQALMEFLMLMPILLALLWYLVHVSAAINTSIVGQKHTRSQLFLKLYNHRAGPVANEFDPALGGPERAVFYIGVSKNPIKGTEKPDAPEVMLGMGMNPKKMDLANDDAGEAGADVFRQKVRVRTVFGICTSRKITPGTSSFTDFCGSESGGD